MATRVAGGTRRDVDERMLTAAELETVVGAADSFGRCGPGDRWKWLGNIYTPQCKAHDAAVRGELAKGSSSFTAQLKSLPLLPAAIGSYLRARFG